MRTYRIGHIGFAHVHAVDNTEPFLPLTKRVEWIGGVDLPTEGSTEIEEPSMRAFNRRWVQRNGALPAEYETVEQLLERKPDIVLVNTENDRHCQIICDALDAGAAVIVEKPMVVTQAEALRVLAKACQHPGQLVVNWPSSWSPSVRTAYRLLREGAVGKPFKLTFRNPHSPGPLGYGQKLTDAQRGREWWYQAEQGGGAMLDYACYGCNVACWFFGAPALRAQGLMANFQNRFGSADDYGLINAVFPEAVAILEGSWTTVHTGVEAGPIVYGSEGTLVSDWSAGSRPLKLYTSMEQRKHIAIAPDALPEGRENLALEVLHHLDTSEALHPTLDLPVNMDAAMLLAAGLRSARSGHIENVQAAPWALSCANESRR